MEPFPSAWSFDAGLLVAIALTAFVYVRGFVRARRQSPGHFGIWRSGCFLLGLAIVGFAVQSPLDAMADWLLQAHMVQHWLLMMVAPPLIWLGAPATPLLRGLPVAWLRSGIGPFLRSPALQNIFHRVTSLGWALGIFIAVTVVWHLPIAYEAALRSSFWHDFEHASFLLASLLFWYPVISPWPERRTFHNGAIILYVGMAALFNTAFSAIFTFSSRVFYAPYAEIPRASALGALDDQNAAGAIMWVATSIPMLVAIAGVTYRMLEPDLKAPETRPHASPLPSSPLAPTVSHGLWQTVLTSHSTRRTLQFVLFGLAAAVVLDGWFGVQRPSATNLASSLPWVYWRGLVVIGLLVAGNAFCAVCPFTLPRGLSARLFGRPWAWPKALRNKWLAAGLFVSYLWVAEAFDVWDSPFWTAWIVVGYFTAAALIEGLFPRGSFCRYVCPIGQFHFVNAGVSPLEIRVRDRKVCTTCTTQDCLKGNSELPGCPTELFVPAKQNDLDCTYCMDCVRACPHDNAALLPVLPAAPLARRKRPRDRRRLDVSFLLLVVCFAAFLNALGMIGPMQTFQAKLGELTGAGDTLVLTLWLIPGLVLAPALATFACAALSRKLSGQSIELRELVGVFTFAFVPLGFSMWFAHYAMHFFMGLSSLPVAIARVLDDLGWVSTTTNWAGMLSWAVVDTENLSMWALGLGLVASIIVCQRVASNVCDRPRGAVVLALPWMALLLGLYAAGIWLLLQPMEMRGMVM